MTFFMILHFKFLLPDNLPSPCRKDNLILRKCFLKVRCPLPHSRKHLISAKNSNTHLLSVITPKSQPLAHLVVSDSEAILSARSVMRERGSWLCSRWWKLWTLELASEGAYGCSNCILLPLLPCCMLLEGCGCGLLCR